MIECSEEFKKALNANRRMVFVRAPFDLRDPDIDIESASSNSNNPYSNIDQATDMKFKLDDSKIGTLEQDRIQLNGSWALPPDDPSDLDGLNIGYWGNTLSGDDGVFPSPQPYVKILFKGISILQAVTIHFSPNSYDGIASEFKLDLYSGDTLVYTTTIQNSKTEAVIEDFTVYDPTSAVVTFLKWSLPSTYPRLAEILFGLYEVWDDDMFESVDIVTESTFSSLSLPISVCIIRIDNHDKRFNPYRENSILKSIKERQQLPLQIGLMTESGKIEYVPAGTYFQQNEGYELDDAIIQFTLTDVIGMLANRSYVVPSDLPTDSEGWLASIVACLGKNLSNRFILDNALKKIPMTTTTEDIQDKSCGDMLRWFCQFVEGWPHQDYPTGNLLVTKLAFDTGMSLNADFMTDYPKMSANKDIADIKFKLDMGEVYFPGTNTDCDESLTINNPFVHTEDEARKVAAFVFRQYGGNMFTVYSRGNLIGETGDIDTVDTSFDVTISGRRYKQEIKVSEGVLEPCNAYLIQTSMDKHYDNKIVLTGTGTWKAPTGVTEIYVQLVGGGDGADGGEGGAWLHEDDYSPKPGKAGKGGRVFIATLSINSGQSFAYSCGKGGKGGAGGAHATFGSPPKDDQQPGEPGTAGTATTFGAYSSVNGKSYPAGITDVETGKYYAADGTDGKAQVDNPKAASSGAPNTGNAGSGGDSGANGYFTVTRVPGHNYYHAHSDPSDGARGGDGADGIIIIQYNDP